MVRYKCRYVLCKIVVTDGKREFVLKETEVMNSIMDEVKHIHGDYAVASMKKTPSIVVGTIDRTSHVVSIKCQRGIHKLLLSAIPFVKKIGERSAFFQTIHVGGTIRSCQKFLIRHYKSQLPLLLYQCKTKEEKDKVKAAILESCQNSAKTIQPPENFFKPTVSDQKTTNINLGKT